MSPIHSFGTGFSRAGNKEVLKNETSGISCVKLKQLSFIDFNAIFSEYMQCMCEFSQCDKSLMIVCVKQ